MANTANHSAKVHKKRLRKYDRQKKADHKEEYHHKKKVDRCRSTPKSAYTKNE